MTPTRRFFVVWAAARAPGSTAPMTGTGSVLCACAKPAAVAVLQAMTTNFTPRSTSHAPICCTKPSTSARSRGPYGQRAESPRYTMDSRGSAFAISRATVNPPNPESNTPMGASFPQLPRSPGTSAERAAGARKTPASDEGVIMSSMPPSIPQAILQQRPNGEALATEHDREPARCQAEAQRAGTGRSEGGGHAEGA